MRQCQYVTDFVIPDSQDKPAYPSVQLQAPVTGLHAVAPFKQKNNLDHMYY